LKKRDWLGNLTPEDMPNRDLKIVAELCGTEVATKLLKELGGIQISIPQNGAKRVLQTYILKRYDGTNVKELAIDTGISERHVYRMLSEMKKS
jgi:Mor family transcriptional regulator